MPGAGATRDPSEGFNVVDVVFLQQMIPHHTQALRIATLASGRAAAPEIERIAAEIQAALPVEIDQMSRALRSIGIDPPAESVGGVHAHAGGMTEEDVTRLGGLAGPDFDAAFASLLSQHSVGSVELARGEAEQGVNAGTRQLAASIAERDSDQVLELAKLPV